MVFNCKKTFESYDKTYTKIRDNFKQHVYKKLKDNAPKSLILVKLHSAITGEKHIPST